MKTALPIVGFAFILLSGLLYIAGGPTIHLLPQNVANMGGMVAAAVGVLVWVIYGITRSQKPTDQSG